LCRAQRNSECFGRFLLAQSGEKPTVNGSGQTLVVLAKAPQGAVEVEQPLGLIVARDSVLVEGQGYGAATPFGCGSRTGMIDDNLAHRACRYGKKMAPVVEANAFLAGQLEIGLMDEARRVECVPPFIPPDVIPRDPAELVIDEGDEAVEGAAITPGVGLEELRDFASLK
jgi:hypothetical protein